jgi:hypothetical protein
MARDEGGYCPQCETTGSPQMDYCPDCGSRLTTTPTASPVPRFSAAQWARLGRETVINTVMLTPVLYVPMALHAAKEARANGAGDAAVRLVTYTLAAAVGWVLLVVSLLTALL